MWYSGFSSLPPPPLFFGPSMLAVERSIVSSFYLQWMFLFAKGGWLRPQSPAAFYKAIHGFKEVAVREGDHFVCKWGTAPAPAALFLFRPSLLTAKTKHRVITMLAVREGNGGVCRSYCLQREGACASRPRFSRAIQLRKSNHSKCCNSQCLQLQHPSASS